MFNLPKPEKPSKADLEKLDEEYVEPEDPHMPTHSNLSFNARCKYKKDNKAWRKAYKKHLKDCLRNLYTELKSTRGGIPDFDEDLYEADEKLWQFMDMEIPEELKTKAIDMILEIVLHEVETVKNPDSREFDDFIRRVSGNDKHRYRTKHSDYVKFNERFDNAIFRVSKKLIF
jgi:hypothetical protein